MCLKTKMKRVFEMSQALTCEQAGRRVGVSRMVLHPSAPQIGYDKVENAWCKGEVCVCNAYSNTQDLYPLGLKLPRFISISCLWDWKEITKWQGWE